MADWTAFDSFVGKVGEVMFRGTTAPDPTKFTLLLLNGFTRVGRRSTIYDIISREVDQATGYSPQAYSPDLGNYATDRERYEFSGKMLVFTADGTSIQFTQAVLWQGRSITANKPIVSVNTGNDQLEVTAHGGSNGDLVAVTSNSSSLPDGVEEQLYYLKVISVDLVELYTDSELANRVNITSTGDSLLLRFANGYPVWFADYDLITISSGNSETVVVETNTFNGGNVNGV